MSAVEGLRKSFYTLWRSEESFLILTRYKRVSHAQLRLIHCLSRNNSHFELESRGFDSCDGASFVFVGGASAAADRTDDFVAAHDQNATRHRDYFTFGHR